MTTICISINGGPLQPITVLTPQEHQRIADERGPIALWVQGCLEIDLDSLMPEGSPAGQMHFTMGASDPLPPGTYESKVVDVRLDPKGSVTFDLAPIQSKHEPDLEPSRCTALVPIKLVKEARFAVSIWTVKPDAASNWTRDFWAKYYQDWNEYMERGYAIRHMEGIQG